ncbi:hypothetical protein [Sutcliffiella deserti]|uniref:hypothetical protein n=1 Tax=Sutcliffiella deserti TaxID=2875501 RepID=UPI001CBD941A|nr:hypothetical protein [Sutcliffiella deserti]
MTCFLHLLFACVLLFNVSTCQSKTKIEKAKETMTEPIASEPLTTPFQMNHIVDINNLNQIRSQSDLRDFLINTYKLPSKWEKKIKNVAVRRNENNRVLAITLEDCSPDEVSRTENRKIIYLKEQQENQPMRIKGLWSYKGSYMTISASDSHARWSPTLNGKSRRKKDVALDESTADKVSDAIIQQQKLDKFSKKGKKNIVLQKDKIIKKMGEKQGGSYFLQTQLDSQNVKQHVRDALLHSVSGAVVIIHFQSPFSKQGKRIKVRVPEFKSRGFRLFIPD